MMTNAEIRAYVRDVQAVVNATNGVIFEHPNSDGDITLVIFPRKRMSLALALRRKKRRRDA